MKRQGLFKKVAFFSVILVLVLVIIYSGLQILEATVFVNDQSETKAPSKTITRNGIDYFPRQDITVMLLMGIDQEGPVKDSGSYNNSGAADAIILLIFDEKEEETTVLCLNRDTMVNMPILGLNGKKAGTLHAQLALSHSYGSGLEDSCENTRTTISDLFYGIRIDYYMAMNMDAIPILNDAVGGVPVYVTDDFSAIDSTIPMGDVVLRGEQSIHFLRTRKGLGDQMNLSRMERHKEYMNGFLEAFQKNMDHSDSFTIDVYDKISDYIVTDCSATTLSNAIDRYSDYDVTQILSPEGQNVLGKQYYEFYLEEEKLDQLILDLFYAPKE